MQTVLPLSAPCRAPELAVILVAGVEHTAAAGCQGEEHDAHLW